MADLELEILFDDLVERFYDEGKDLDTIEEMLHFEVERAVEEKRAEVEPDEGKEDADDNGDDDE